MHCLSMKMRGLLSFGVSVTVYQLTQHNIPQDFILHILIVLVILQLDLSVCLRHV